MEVFGWGSFGANKPELFDVPCVRLFAAMACVRAAVVAPAFPMMGSSGDAQRVGARFRLRRQRTHCRVGVARRTPCDAVVAPSSTRTGDGTWRRGRRRGVGSHGDRVGGVCPLL